MEPFVKSHCHFVVVHFILSLVVFLFVQNPVMLRVRFSFKTALDQPVDDMVEFTVPSTL